LFPKRSSQRRFRPPSGPRCRGLGAAALGLAIALLAQGCAPLVLGGAAVGAAAVYDRRDYRAVIDDQEIELRAMAALSQDPQLTGRARISVTSYNRTVLLVGQAYEEALAARAAGLVSGLPKVVRVIDEVAVRPPISLAREGEDVLITSKAKLALAKVRVPGFDPTRVKVVTEDGVVYLLGLVSPEEGDAAAEQVRFVAGVQRVVKLFEHHTTSAADPA
jgi:osmotically-inducible protein OsmY